MQAAYQPRTSRDAKARHLRVSSTPRRAIPQFSAAPSPVVQAKLRIGASNDRFERQADRMADTVMRTPETLPSSRTTSVKRTILRTMQCQDLSRERGAPMSGQTRVEKEKLETGSPLGTGNPSSVEIEDRIRNILHRSRPLPESERHDFGSRLGTDLSGVRMIEDHPDGPTHDLNARAFALGNHIVFGHGQFQPHTNDGRRLIAHELVHVLQSQDNGEGAAVARDHQPLTRSAPRQRADANVIMRSLQTTQADFHDPNFCFRPGSPRDAQHPDRTKVVAVIQAQIDTPDSCDGEVILRTSVLQSHWGAEDAMFESYGGGEAQGTMEGLYRDSNAERVDYEEHFHLDLCHANFARAHMVTFYEGSTRYAFGEARYDPEISATSDPGGTVMLDNTPQPRLRVDPCDHVARTL